MEELWKPIPNYQYYEASNLGRIRSITRTITSHRNGKPYLTTKQGQILKPNIGKNNYVQVSVYVNNKNKHPYIHTLVALAFLPNPNNYKEINHKDENPQNNCVDNLEWCSRVYNVNYGQRTAKAAKTNSMVQKGKILSEEHLQKLREAAKKANRPKKPCYSVDSEGIITEYSSIAEAAKSVGSPSKTPILKCLQGKQTFSYGRAWYFKELQRAS